MSIKASGKWMKDALNENIFVNVNYHNIIDSIDSEKEYMTEISKYNEILKPSIETPLHALMSFKFVLHTHSVNAISHLIQGDSSQLQQIFSQFNHKFIPYTKPGWKLASIVKNIRVLTS